MRCFSSFAGVRNFVPHPTSDGYEPFSQLIDKANTWLKDQTDIRLTNMQSVLVQKDMGMDKALLSMIVTVRNITYKMTLK